MSDPTVAGYVALCLAPVVFGGAVELYSAVKGKGPYSDQGREHYSQK